DPPGQAGRCAPSLAQPAARLVRARRADAARQTGDRGARRRRRDGRPTPQRDRTRVILPCADTVSGRGTASWVRPRAAPKCPPAGPWAKRTTHRMHVWLFWLEQVYVERDHTAYVPGLG